MVLVSNKAHWFDSCLQGGQFMLNLIDFYGGAMISFLLAIIEVSTVVFWYGECHPIIGFRCSWIVSFSLAGVENISWDIEFMLNEKVGVYWRICWRIAPVVLGTIYVYFLATLTRLKYGLYDYPDIALGKIKIRACISICTLCIA